MGFIFEDCPDCGMVEGHLGECPKPKSLGDGLFVLYKDFTVQEVTLVTNRTMGDVIGYVASYHYPDPLTTAEGFLALWDALEYSGHYLTFQSRDAGCKVTIGVGVGKNGRTSHVVGKSQNKDRKAALVEAAGRALGVTR